MHAAALCMPRPPATAWAAVPRCASRAAYTLNSLCDAACSLWLLPAAGPVCSGLCQACGHFRACWTSIEKPALRSRHAGRGAGGTLPKAPAAGDLARVPICSTCEQHGPAWSQLCDAHPPPGLAPCVAARGAAARRERRRRRSRRHAQPPRASVGQHRCSVCKREPASTADGATGIADATTTAAAAGRCSTGGASLHRCLRCGE